MKRILSIVILGVALSACSNQAKEEALIKQKAIAAVKDSLKLDSFKRAEVARAKEKEEQRLAQIKEESRVLLLSERNEAASARSSSESTAPAKKGWSQAAKGAVIGAGAGALGGVIVDKKDGRGALIGGVVGAGTGYLIGRGQDRKSGRVQPKN